MYYPLPLSSSNVQMYTHRGGKGRLETVRMPLPSQLERTLQLGSWWLHWVHLLLCPSTIFRQKYSFPWLVYSALFNNVFKALNLFLKKDSINLAAWQGHFAALHTTEALHSVLTWLDIGDLHQKMWRTKAAVVDSSLQLIIFAQPLSMARPFKLPSHCKTYSPAPFLKLIWARWQSG